MKLLITSDVHGHEERLVEVIAKHKDVDFHINAGDMCLDSHVYQKYHIITVKGNNDFFTSEPLKRVFDLNGLKVLLTHGHIEHVKHNLDILKFYAKQLNVDLVVFGHTHQQYLEIDQNITILNPGALGDYHKSYAIYDNGQVTFYEL
ncbi:MAG: YfcE family phosphodiesterase [Acholeplasmataceae bacterium]